MSSAVLLAEPEEATRSFLERHLAQDGFEVVGVPDGEALELIDRMCPDLVLIGDPEGLELCRRLRERDREVPVILLGSQESDPVDRVRAFESGLLHLIHSKHADILNAIRDSRDLDDAVTAKLKAAVDDYAKAFA